MLRRLLPARAALRRLWGLTKRPARWSAVLLVIFWLLLVTGMVDRWARNAIVHRIERASGGRVELQRFRFAFFALRAELEGFTLHGREPAGTPPFFHADRLVVDIRVDSLLRRQISLDEVQLLRPTVHLRTDEKGESNLPLPAPTGTATGAPLRERIFDLVIRRVRIADGRLLFRRQSVPVVAEGGDFQLTLDHQVKDGAPAYRGEVAWKDWQLALRRYQPFASQLAVTFTLSRSSFVLEEIHWKLPQSTITARAALPQVAEPRWELAWSSEVSFADLRRILRMPNFPDGRARFDGAGSWRGGALDLRGKFVAQEVDLPYRWFHTRGLEGGGSYRATAKALEVPDFSARALGGSVIGRVDLEFAGMKFRTRLRAQDLDVAGTLRALDHPGFPVETFRWDGRMDLDADTSWSEDFRHLDAKGVALWSPAEAPATGRIPVTARLDYHFLRDREAVTVRRSYIATHASRLEMDGRLGAHDSALLVKLDARDLLDWNGFIHALQGPQPAPPRIAGHATFDGSVIGRLASPVFNGRAVVHRAAYGSLYWDRIEGELLYSPAELRLERAAMHRSRSSATFDLTLGLEDWAFVPHSPWSLSAELVRAPTEELQSFLGTKYPVRGLLTGQFRAGGTRADPTFSGLFDLTEGETAGLRVDRARGQVQLTREELRISNAEVRKASGRITGNLRLRFADYHVAFDAAGAVIPIEQLEWLRFPRVPLAGQLSFQLRGEGPLNAPVAEGSARLVDLRVGDELLGSFETRLRADGRRVRAELTSAMADGSAQGTLEANLAGDYPVTGDVSVQQVDLDAFFQTAFRLPHTSFTGHSRVDGRFRLTGNLARPESLAVDADISRLTFGYEQVRLENAGPVRLRYRGEEVRVEQAQLRGADTDFALTGFVRFSGDRRLGLNLTGQVNLQLLGGFLPDLEARGSARVNTTIEGTLAAPRINGRVSVAEAAANYADFPVGLSRLSGEFVFDAARMTFENVSAESGGGRLLLGGSLTYGEGPLRYDLSIETRRVRIRYPPGLSWLAGASLRFAGNTRGALLSGRINVERLLLSDSFDFASLLVSSEAAGRAPGTTSAFLRNLQFDIEAVSTPDARMEWATARFDSEAQLRIRGTWERPIILGHIHLLSGEITFRGNRYTLTRGDVSFSNPFRLDPVLNVEAVTAVRQYEVTLNFTGPTSRLTLAYRSDPPLPQNDVVALLALGRTSQESELRSGAGTSAQSAGQGATALLSEAISSQIGGRIERLFGVSRFRIDPFLAGTGSEQNTSARITIEQQVARDLVITYITNVSSNQQQVIQIEYAVNREVSIVALRDLNGTFGFDVKFKKRFK
jgi:translocation and assembly module TamB